MWRCQRPVIALSRSKKGAIQLGYAGANVSGLLKVCAQRGGGDQ
jgi:hypothetical protein